MRMRIVLAACLAACGWWSGPVAFGHARAAEEGDPARKLELERLVAEAADSYNAGRWAEAKAALDKIVAENPTHTEAWQLREIFGDRLLRQMALALQEGRDLGRGAEILLTRAQEHERDLLTAPQRLKTIVRDAIENPRNRRAMYEVNLVGAFAAPELLRQMRTADQDAHRRANAAFLFMQLGPQMVVPLTVALEGLNDQKEWGDDQAALAQQIADILRRILPRDPRALPSLTRLAEDARRPNSAREFARRAAAEIAGGSLAENGADGISAADRYFHAAERLHLGGPAVEREIDHLQGLFFAWDPRLDGDKGGLAYRVVPAFVLNDLYAQHLAMIGMNLPDPAAAARFQPLLARVWMAQAAEIEELGSIVGRQGIIHPDTPADEARVQAWKEYLESTRRKAWNVGAPGLARALADALLAGDANVVVGLLDGLALVADWDQLKDLEPNPVLAALSHADHRIRQRAAVALAQLNLPVGHPRHADLVPPLVEGAAMKTAKVVLVIANNADVREDTARRLEAKGFVVLTAAGGQDGLRLAWQYPLKDAVLVDSEVEEFARLRQRLLALNLVAGSELPVVIVTNNQRAARIAAQFENDPLWKAAPPRTNVGVETRGLYESLVALNRGADAGQRVVAILTNDDPQARADLALHLRLTVERRANPALQGELLDLLADRRLQGDGPAEMRSLFSNVFLDDEISGANAMQVLQALRLNPLTRKTPVALLCGPENRDQVKQQFAEFLKNAADARTLDYHEPVDSLAAAVDTMSEANPLVQIDFQKRYFRDAARRAAEALGRYRRAEGQQFDADQSERLQLALRDDSRPLDVRVALAKALGWWRDAQASTSLSAVFRAKASDPTLRLECLVALGKADTVGKEHAVKQAALNESAVVLRDAAAAALARETTPPAGRIPVIMALWHNEPIRIIDMDTARRAASAAAAEEEEAAEAGQAPAAGEESEGNEGAAEAATDEAAAADADSDW